MNSFKLVAATLCLSLVLLPTQDMPRAEEVADQFDCTACHPAKIRDFKGRRANPVTPVEEFPELPTGKQDVASSPGMCFSCHDGFVMDSRFMWQDGDYHGHRIGMAPPEDMTPPEFNGSPEFPLNSDGNVYCGTCHSGHVNDAEGAFAKTETFMRQSADGGRICTACHVENAAIKGSAHDKGGRRNMDFESRGTCGGCHVAHGSDQLLMWAKDLGEAELPLNRLCRSCHEDAPNPAEPGTACPVVCAPACRAVRRSCTKPAA